MKRANWVWTLFFVSIFLIALSCRSEAGWQTGKNHWPRLIYEASDLSRIQGHVSSDREPFRTLWARVQAKANGNIKHWTNDWNTEYANASIAKSAAFVHTMTGDTAFAQKAWNALVNMKCDAKWWDTGDCHDAIKMAQSLTAHCQAYDILRGAGYWQDPTHTKVRENLAKLADDLFAIGKKSLYWLNTNYQLKITSAVGLTAITLNTGDKADEWINWSMTKFWQVFQDLTSSEGGYAEGPSYLFYSAGNYLPFMRAYNLFMDGQGGNYEGGSGRYWIPNFLSDPRVKAVHDWGVKIRMPNGTRPGYDDSYYMPFVSGLLATSANTSGHGTDHVPGTATDHYAWDWYTFETLPQTGRASFCSDYGVDLSVDVLCSFDADMQRRPPAWRPTQFLPGAGNAVFRDHWGKGATYLLLLGENDSMIARTKDPLGSYQESHEHPDNTGIVLYAHDELLALDSGYASWDKRGTTKSPKNHNLVTIEGNISSYDYYNDAVIDHSFDTGFMDFAEVLTHIEVGYTTGYKELSYVNDRRSVIFPNHRYFVMVDALNPVETPYGLSRLHHTYAWRLHGNGLSGKAHDSLEGSYTHVDGQGGIWTRANGQLQAFVTSTRTAPQVSHYVDYHALGWKASSQPLDTHEVLMAKKTVSSGASAKDVRFLSVLYPADASATLPSITPLTVTDGAAVRIEEPEAAGGQTAIAVTKENWDTVILPDADSTVGEIETNGRILFVQFDAAANRLNQVFGKNISYLDHNGSTVFSAADWIYHIALGFGDNRVSGYLIFTGSHGKPYVDIQTPWDDVIVEGDTVEDWQPLGGGMIRLWLSKSGPFTIYDAGAMPPLENGEFESDLNGWERSGDGDSYTTTLVDGARCAAISREHETGNFFALKQRHLPCEPNTTYELSLWMKTELTSGSIAAGLGNWGDPNSHLDYGHLGGDTDWTQISGTWTSGPDEDSLDIILYGAPAFAGTAYFDGLTVQPLYPANPGFEHGLNGWEAYSDGTVEIVEGGTEGTDCLRLSRLNGTGKFFGVVQRTIPCEPNTVYRLTLWAATDADEGYVAAGLGNWGSPNTHQDFGYVQGNSNWTEISGTWTSGPDETSMDIRLFGGEDFEGVAYLDDLILERVGPAPLEADILGPSVLGYKERGTFRAVVQRGSGNYMYEWYRQWDGSSQWLRISTAEQFALTMINKGFTLDVDVTDAQTGETASATKRVRYAKDNPAKAKSPDDPLKPVSKDNGMASGELLTVD